MTVLYKEVETSSAEWPFSNYLGSYAINQMRHTLKKIEKFFCSIPVIVGFEKRAMLTT